MFGTLLWRLQEALLVITGKKQTHTVRQKNALKPQLSPDLFLNNHPQLKDLVSAITMEFCFAEFGAERVNAGGSKISDFPRLDPTLTSIKQYFPSATITVYTDFLQDVEGINIIKCASPFEETDHPRHLYRTADYFKFLSLVKSEADFCCVMDTDMQIVSPEVYALVNLTRTFGSCTAANPRNLLKKDMSISLDALSITDNSLGLGHSYNQSPMTIWKNHSQSKSYFNLCAEIMLTEPSRASLVMWKAARQLGFSPYLLPAEWCVCTEDVGIGNEIILHVGHTAVQKYYDLI